MGVNEFVILQVRIKSAHAIYLFRLTGRQVFARIETPAPFKQALSPQDFVNSRNTSTKVVRRIE